MSNPEKFPSLQDLGRRIAKVRHDAGLNRRDERREPPPAGEVGLAWRISIEIVVALVLATGLGWVLDRWFGTTPWLMVVFLFLGAAAGINNAVRTMNRMDRLAAERAAEAARQARRDAGAEDGRGTGRGG
jgi:ATP synthase protein I